MSDEDYKEMDEDYKELCMKKQFYDLQIRKAQIYWSISTCLLGLILNYKISGKP